MSVLAVANKAMSVAISSLKISEVIENNKGGG